MLPETQGLKFFPLLRRLALHLAAFLLVCAAVYGLWREFHAVDPSEVARAAGAWGWNSVVGALLLSALSFLLMGFVEWMGLRWTGARVAMLPTLGVSFVASAMAHSLGANLLVSGAIRARLYRRHGVTLRQVAATTLFQGFTFAVGLATLTALSLLVSGGREMSEATRIPARVGDGLGIALLAATLAYIGLCTWLRRPLSAFGHSVRLPSGRVALAQTLIGAIDNAVAACIFWILLPPASGGFFTFVAAYAPSVVLGLISHVPAGVGVFESSLATLLRGAPPAALAAAFLGYRMFFFALPLAIAGLALAYDSLRRRGPAN